MQKNPQYLDGRSESVGFVKLIVLIWRLCYRRKNSGNINSSARTETASFGQIPRFRNFLILDVAPLRLRSENSCGLVFGQNLIFRSDTK
jgi:hypothetical protein